MLKIESILQNADNSGILTGKIIHVYKNGDKKTAAYLKDHILIASQKTDFRKLQTKIISRAILIKQRKNIRRLNGHYIKFRIASFLPLDEAKTFKGSIIRGPVAAELKYQSIIDIISVAKAVI